MRVEVYWNLHKLLWSIRHNGKVVYHAESVTIADAQFVVQPAGRARVLKERRKNVHAFVRGRLVAVNSDLPILCDGLLGERAVLESLEHGDDDRDGDIGIRFDPRPDGTRILPVRYNPYTMDTFQIKDSSYWGSDWAPVHKSPGVWLNLGYQVSATGPRATGPRSRPIVSAIAP